MRKSLKTGKIQLDENIITVVENMIGELRKLSPDFNPTPSAFVNECMKIFGEKLFVKAKSDLLARLYDERSYAKRKLLKGELSKAVLELLEKEHRKEVVEAEKRLMTSSNKPSENDLEESEV